MPCIEASLIRRQKTFGNVQDAEKLAEQIKSLREVFERSKKEGTLSPEVIDRVDRLASSVATSAPLNLSNLSTVHGRGHPLKCRR
jgi:hypothetical protein